MDRATVDPIVFFRKVHVRARPPVKATPFAAGFDLRSIDSIVISPGSSQLLKTGIAVEIPEGFAGRIASRSGLAFKQRLVAFEGVIDADFRGEISVLLWNNGSDEVKIHEDDRIAQLVLTKIHTSHALQEKHHLTATERGVGGFGSTGLQ